MPKRCTLAGNHIASTLTPGEVRGLEMKLGQLFHFIPTNPTGHYRLELGNRHDRILAKKLIEISSEERQARRTERFGRGGKNSKKGTGGKRGMVDTSQGGDWDNWRNESLDGEPLDYDSNRPVIQPRLPPSSTDSPQLEDWYERLSVLWSAHFGC